MHVGRANHGLTEWTEQAQTLLVGVKPLTTNRGCENKQQLTAQIGMAFKS